MPVPGGLGCRSPLSIALGRPRSPQTATRSAPRRRQQTLRGTYRTRAASLACQYGSYVAPAPGGDPPRVDTSLRRPRTRLDQNGDSAGCALKLRTHAGADAAAIWMRLVASTRSLTLTSGSPTSGPDARSTARRALRPRAACSVPGPANAFGRARAQRRALVLARRHGHPVPCVPWRPSAPPPLALAQRRARAGSGGVGRMDAVERESAVADQE
jgi:hypothetical protein